MKIYLREYCRTSNCNSKIAEQVGVSPTIPRVVGTQIYRANYEIHNNNSVSYYRKYIFYPYLDDMIMSLNERFSFQILDY